MKKISLTQGKFALCDDEDYDELMKYQWYAFFDGGRWRSARKDKQKKIIYLHRQIMNAKKGEQIDHCDGNPLNNQKGNLRFSTQRENMWNRRANKAGTSKFKGVSWHKRASKWHAQIRVYGKKKYLGLFHDELEAVEAYRKAAKQLHGEFYREINHKREG